MVHEEEQQNGLKHFLFKNILTSEKSCVEQNLF